MEAHTPLNFYDLKEGPKSTQPKDSHQETALSLNAMTVLKRRYLKKDAKGSIIERPKDLFLRVAKAIARADGLYGASPAEIKNTEEEFLHLITNLYFLPNSPTLMNAGTDLGQLSACFVLPVEDSMEGIFEAVKNTALIHKTGGGTGFAFSKLRPKDSIVGSTGGVASGPISFIKVFDKATDVIKQGGKRRGANMGILRVDHPDIIDFITSKESENTLNNFNISVGITTAFMEAVESDKEIPLIHPGTCEATKYIRAQELFDLIVDMAWRNGEPGVIFLDRINRDNSTPKLGEIESTNPCGEQPLLPYESCNLGSINLAKMAKDGGVDYPKLRSVVHSSVHFLDNVIDINKYPLKIIEEMTEKNRKIGLGVMGWADLLALLSIPYNSHRAIQMAEEVMKFIRDEAREMSRNLASVRGAFPSFKESIYDNENQPPLRNATLTTIAPTGTISIISGCSSGIEPFFALSYERHVMDNDVLVEVNTTLKNMLKKNGYYNSTILEQIKKHGSLKPIEGIPDHIKEFFLTSHEIPTEWHIRMQAAFQKYVDNAVSKTVNFSNNATCEDVANVYKLAYKLGCKGVTIYRDGSRERQVLNINKVPTEKGLQRAPSLEIQKKGSPEDTSRLKIMPRPRPIRTEGSTQKIGTGCGNLYVTINRDEEGPCEIFTQMGKSGGCAASQSEAVSRLISLALRSGISLDSIIKQLKGIRCPAPLWHNGTMVLSCPDAISKTIESYLEHGGIDVKKESKDPILKVSTKDILGMCPDCGHVMEFIEGCAVCKACGFSRCG